ncbi:MAG: sulfurtransferase TusA family protein [Bacillaceae bacterium]|nr:sulfurtransferase TusA family protein [Bacillaceae bacterium]
MQENHVLDIKGFSCTMLIVKTKNAIDKLNPGDVLEVHTTDRGAVNDLKAWTRSVGHEIIDFQEEDDVLKFWIKKG